MFGNAKKPAKANIVVRKAQVATAAAAPAINGNAQRRPVPTLNGSSSKLLKARDAGRKAHDANEARYLGVIRRQDSKTASPSPARSVSPGRRASSSVKRKKESPSPVDFGRDSSSDEDESLRKRIRPSPRNGTLEPDMKRRLLDEEAMKNPAAASEDDSDIVQGYDLTFGKIKEYNSYMSKTGQDDGEIAIAELQYPSRCAREKFQLVFPSDNSDYNPLNDIVASVEHICTHYFPEEKAAMLSDDITGYSYPLNRLYTYFLDDDIVAFTCSCFCPRRFQHKRHPHPVWFYSPIRRALRKREGPAFLEALDNFNKFLVESLDDGSIQAHIKSKHTLELPLVERILSQIYARTVSPDVKSLQRYENGTDDVYGELLPRLVHQIFLDTELRSDQVFVDLGSGVGNVVLQAALEIGCEAWGVEKMENPSRLAVKQLAEFETRCKRWAIKPGKATVISGDFLNTPAIDSVLSRADVVLINNQAFTPNLNNSLLHKFLDLKDGCRIVSLKSFLPDNWKLRPEKTEDPKNFLGSNVKKEYFSDSVSWTGVGGNYYVAVKDKRPLQKFHEKLERQRAREAERARVKESSKSPAQNGA